MMVISYPTHRRKSFFLGFQDFGNDLRNRQALLVDASILLGGTLFEKLGEMKENYTYIFF